MVLRVHVDGTVRGRFVDADRDVVRFTLSSLTSMLRLLVRSLVFEYIVADKSSRVDAWNTNARSQVDQRPARLVPLA